MVTTSLFVYAQEGKSTGDDKKLFKQKGENYYETCVNCVRNEMLAEILTDEDPFSIKIVGNGNIQNSLESGTDIPTNTGIGISVVKYLYEEREGGQEGEMKIAHNTFAGFYKVTLDASINVASTVDTLVANFEDQEVTNQSDFGTSILTPLNQGGGQAADIELTGFYAQTKGKLLSGLRLRYIGSNRNWDLPDSNGSNLEKVTTNMLRFGGFHEFVVPQSRKDYSVTLGVAYAYNGIAGDLGLEKNDDIREAILGTTKRHYHGAEIGLNFRLKNVRVNFSYPVFPWQGQVSGLTGGRLVTGISFIGGFGIDVGKEKENNEDA
ncbi:MAG: hypothetical protein JJ975_02685 [Bacteroidia bacterium]|nr:hypothetical protein [Bacteroidia bacterium]